MRRKAETGVRHVCIHGSQRRWQSRREAWSLRRGPRTPQPPMPSLPPVRHQIRLFKPLSLDLVTSPGPQHREVTGLGHQDSSFPQIHTLQGEGDRPSSHVKPGDDPGKARSPPCGEAGRVQGHSAPPRAAPPHICRRMRAQLFHPPESSQESTLPKHPVLISYP